jgi:hypothetical protein
MSDKMRWRYGDTNPVVAAVDSGTAIEIGDLVWQDTDDAKPAASAVWTTDLAGTQGAFTPKFLGVAMQRSRSGDTAPIRVATSGVFEFDCASTTAELGATVGATANSGGTALENQTVVAVGNNATSKRPPVPVCRLEIILLGQLFAITFIAILIPKKR